AEKSARARETKTALAVLADVPCAGGENGVADPLQIGVRREDHDLALPRAVLAPQRLHAGQLQAFGEDVVNAAAGGVEPGWRAVCTEGGGRAVAAATGWGKRREHAPFGVRRRDALGRTKQNWMMRDDQLTAFVDCLSRGTGGDRKATQHAFDPRRFVTQEQTD